MPNIHKSQLLSNFQKRFGEVHKLDDSQSLFVIGDNAARVYIRYSKIHPGGKTFFGLRKSDLDQMEGHNSFICFLVDNNSPPIFVPYVDFEEVFRTAKPADDGQYKVVVIYKNDVTELYIPHHGRFNVEGYIGIDYLEQNIDNKNLMEKRDFSHSQIQTLLAGIGHLKGFDIFVPSNNMDAIDWTLTKKFPLLQMIPNGYDRIKAILSEIDVIWVTSGRHSVETLFEVEHSTPFYSGLLRFNDVLLTDPKVSRFMIVSNDSRREQFIRQMFRPTFKKSGLADIVSFLEYTNVYDWHQRLSKGGLP